MSASLVEMALAIAIAGLVFVGAIIPTVQTAVTYQKVEAEVRAATSQATALTRAEQIVGSVWRGAAPPPDHAQLDAAQAGTLQAGPWQLRRAQDRFEQKRKAVPWATLAQPVEKLSFRYLLNNGAWKSSVGQGRLDKVLAVRFDWQDPVSGRKYGGLALVPDLPFSTALLRLAQPDASEPYERKDYERTIVLSLGSWK